MNKADREGKADTHIHSNISDGSASISEILEFVEEDSDLDVIAITDHDDIRGGYQARELAAQRKYRFEVVTGMEVSTLEGHLLALFIERPVPRFQRVVKTIEAVHAQGGICVVPHPMSWLTHSLGQRTLDGISRMEHVYLDGIETSSPSIAARVTRKKTRRLNNERYHLAETGGSDAHSLLSIGGGYTVFPGRSATDLKRAILGKRTQGDIGAPVRLWDFRCSELAKHLLTGLTFYPAHMINAWLKRILRIY